jgi:hypothetical protein
LPETITIDGRGDTIQDAIKEMWARMQPLEQKGYNPISVVEIVDEKTKEIIETYQLDDPEFQANLKPDQSKRAVKAEQEDRSHEPERKEHYAYVARIRLA